MNCKKQWETIGLHPHHGIQVPLFSLHTKSSCGIGEFLDLLPLIDWCKSVGFDVIEILPINDTGDDKSPYNPLSSCALDPVHLSLASLPGGPSIEPFAPFQPLQRLAYAEIKRLKLTWLYEYYQKSFPTLSTQPEYQQFLKTSPWLSEYALFLAIRSEYGGKNWKDWPPALQTYNETEIDARKTQVDFHRFVQYLCYSQMSQVKAYANTNNVFLKGDLPILISPDSVDVWAHRSLFCLDLDAGAPPDYYNRLGQHWGFPLFHWDVMRKNHYAWWKRRLASYEPFFHIYRIDHVVGFFRIWGIPKGKKPTEGSFIPEDSTHWMPQGREILQMMIDSSPLLPMAEDLGVVPPTVTTLLHTLGICTMKVLRWQRTPGQGYLPLSQYEPFSLSTLSTPDMDLLQVWWKKFPEEAIPFAHFKQWDYHPDLTPEQRKEILTDLHASSSLFHINLLQEYLALFPDLVWPNPEDERINIPGTLLPTNWTYRLRRPLETLLAHQPLRNALREILQSH